MKKSFGTKMKVWAIGALAVVASGTFTSCHEEIAEENRFTFKGELISNHLENNERYSNFCTIYAKLCYNRLVKYQIMKSEKYRYNKALPS